MIKTALEKLLSVSAAKLSYDYSIMVDYLIDQRRVTTEKTPNKAEIIPYQ